MIIIVDVVESVRFIAEAGGQFIARWVELRHGVEQIIAGAGGDARLVRSSGDGIIAECGTVRTAVDVAFGALRLVRGKFGTPAAPSTLAIRIGLASGSYLFDERDIYGECVNLAARLSTLANINGVVASVDVADEVRSLGNATLFDMGMCFLKHLSQPVRAFALTPPGESVEGAFLLTPNVKILPSIAVIPLAPRQEPTDLIGDIIAEDIIRGLSGAQYLQVVSRLSTAQFRQLADQPVEIRKALGADYAVHGFYVAKRSRIAAQVTLSDCKSGEILLQQGFDFPRADLSRPSFAVFDAFAAEAMRAVLRSERRQLRRQMMPTIASHSLLLGAVSMMHGVSISDFGRAGEALNVLIERHPREALPRAWYACWQSIQVAKGLSANPQIDGMRADEQARRAMDLDPENALAVSVAGLISTNFNKKFDEAERLFDEALAIDPNNTHAVLHMGALHLFTDRGETAYALCRKAQSLSPCDPHLYYFEAITASAAFVAMNYAAALEHAHSAIRHNRFYTPALRVLAAALALTDRLEEARHAATALLQVEPDLTVSRWVRRSPSTGFENGARLAAGLRLAGIPE